MDNFGLYVIATRPTLSYGRVAEICVENDIRFLQLREKHLSDREILNAAREIKSVTHGSNTLFVMNDRADLALLSEADVLHLGQDDLPINEVRTIVGNMPIGLSTHSITQAMNALAENPMYIGFGPVYPTTTKASPDPTVGVELLSEIIKLSSVPVVAIGGIFPENISEVFAAGAKNVSLVRHFMCNEMECRIKNLKNLFV